jgi:hypothetical protein
MFLYMTDDILHLRSKRLLIQGMGGYTNCFGLGGRGFFLKGLIQ